jgi:hypothetical protein
MGEQSRFVTPIQHLSMEISWLLLASTLLLSPFNLSSVAADVEVRLLKLLERYGPVVTLQMAPG